MAAEECKNPKKDIPKGFILAMVTLVILALLTFFITAANIDSSVLSKTDSPLPATLEAIYGAGNILSKIMSFIGLFGLVASLHGIIIGYSRQAFAICYYFIYTKLTSNAFDKKELEEKAG